LKGKPQEQKNIYMHPCLSKSVYYNIKYLRKFKEHSVATAFASSVLPVPGGPYNNTPVE